MNACDTRYPIVLVHGVGFRDIKHLNYWGRIPAALEERGARIFYGSQDSLGSIESNALQLKARVLEILDETGAEKVNLIGHSKGGLDSRYMISLGMQDCVASLTTLATPHHGSVSVDKLLSTPDFIVRIVAFFCNVWTRVVGDKSPDTYRMFQQLTTRFASEFNAATPDMPGVFYQSFAFAMSRPTSDMLLWIPHLFVRHFEGECDGLITPKSATWGEFRGIVRGSTNRGISHCDEVDLRRRRFSKAEKDGHISDIVTLYIDIVEDLKNRGF